MTGASGGLFGFQGTIRFAPLRSQAAPLSSSRPSSQLGSPETPCRRRCRTNPASATSQVGDQRGDTPLVSFLGALLSCHPEPKAKDLTRLQRRRFFANAQNDKQGGQLRASSWGRFLDGLGKFRECHITGSYRLAHAGQKLSEMWHTAR